MDEESPWDILEPSAPRRQLQRWQRWPGKCLSYRWRKDQLETKVIAASKKLPTFTVLEFCMRAFSDRAHIWSIRQKVRDNIDAQDTCADDKETCFSCERQFFLILYFENDSFLHGLARQIKWCCPSPFVLSLFVKNARLDGHLCACT